MRLFTQNHLLLSFFGGPTPKNEDVVRSAHEHERGRHQAPTLRTFGGARSRDGPIIRLLISLYPQSRSREKNTLHRVPVGQGYLPPRPTRVLGFWSLRALAKARRGQVYVQFIIISRSGGNLITKNPSPRIDPGECPADSGWNGKRGTISRNKNEANPQSLGQETPLFFLGRHTTAVGREARMTEVELQRPEAGSKTDPSHQPSRRSG